MEYQTLYRIFVSDLITEIATPKKSGKFYIMTLLELSERIPQGNYWSKAGKERIYLEGTRTKKMQETVYVYQRDNGDFKVACYIKCPSQPWQWIESQQNQTIDRVQEMVDLLTAPYVYVLKAKDSDLYFAGWNTPEPLSEAEKFLTEDLAAAEKEDIPFEVEIVRIENC